MDRQARKELVAAYREARPGAGVYRIHNTRTGRSLVGSTPNMPSMQKRFEFAQQVNSPGALDGRLKADIAAHGIDAFTFEVLEHLDAPSDAPPTQVERDLAALLDLWRERLAAEGELY